MADKKIAQLTNSAPLLTDLIPKQEPTGAAEAANVTFQQVKDLVNVGVEIIANKQANLTASAIAYPTVNAVNAGLATKQATIGFTPENVANKSDDQTLASASATKYVTERAAKLFSEGLVVGLLSDRGNYDASGNTFPTTGGRGIAGAPLLGDLYFISVAGTLGGVAVTVGYSVRALVNSPGQVSANWGILNVGLGFVPENVVNKSTNVITDAASDTKYPSVKAVKTYADSIGGNGGNSVAKITIPSAELLQLHVTPKTLIAPPGAGKFILPIKIVFKYNYGTIAYTGQVVTIGFTDGLTTAASFVFSGINSTNNVYFLSTSPNNFTVSNIENFSLNAGIGGAITGGDGTLDIYITYQVITI